MLFVSLCCIHLVLVLQYQRHHSPCYSNSNTTITHQCTPEVTTVPKHLKHVSFSPLYHGAITDPYIYSGTKKYLVSHQLCTFSHLKRWERPVIGTFQLWQTKWEKTFFNEIICKLWWKISIWSKTKVYLNTLLYTLCWQWQRSNVFCCWYFGPFLHADLL